MTCGWSDMPDVLRLRGCRHKKNRGRIMPYPAPQSTPRVCIGKLRTIRLKARIIFTWHDVIMLWWVLDMTHRQTEEPGWNDHGVSLARWDSLQTDYSGCRGLLVSCV